MKILAAVGYLTLFRDFLTGSYDKDTIDLLVVTKF